MILFNVLSTLWRLLEKRRRFILVGLIGALFVTGFLEMAGMVLLFGFLRGLHVNGEAHRRGGWLGHLLERVLGGPVSDLEFALLGGSIVVSAIALKNVQGLMVRYQVERFLSNLERRIALQLFGALTTLPYEQIVVDGSSRLRDRLKKRMQALSLSFRAATQVLADGAIVSTVIALLCLVSPMLTLLGVGLFGGLGFLLYRLLQARLRQIGRAEQAAKGRLAATMEDVFGGLIEARIRNQVGYYQHRYNADLGERLRISRQQRAYARVPGSANEILLALAIVGAVLYLALAQSNIANALSLLGIFGFAGMRLNGAMSRIHKALQRLRQEADKYRTAIADLELLVPRAFGSDDVTVPTYLAFEKPLPNGRDGRLTEALELRKVNFMYQGAGRLSVRNVSLTIRRGQFVAFCGESGSGKSTLLMLIMGLLWPKKGEILCDGWSVFEHIRAWHRNIGYVGQSPYVAAATIRQNVAFGVPEEQIEDAKVWHALTLAAAREFVEELPDRLTTILSGGTRLSGGQLQRIVIARALYHDPDIVIFDEATAALDNVTEQEITNAAIRLAKKKTVICVAHRLSTIQESDVIYVMADGRIVGSGTYDDLSQNNEHFRRLALLA